jgi:DNA-binding transcriptional MerR regulator
MSDKTPTYNLKAVVHETGLKPDTLRAWERRYGVPAPPRTDSGHRLYSQHDIDTLKWLLLRQHEGMSISRAVELWRRMEQDGLDPLATGLETPRPPESRSPQSPAASLPVRPEGDAIAALRHAWVSACLAFDEQHAEQALAQAFALFPAETVCLDLIQKGLAEIGDGWYRGAVTVQQEHFASALALRRMEALLISTPAPTRPGRILVGCPPEEEHTFVPLLLSLLLRRRGWDVVYLGANVPIHSIEATIAVVRPNLVVLTAQQLYTAAGLLEMAEVLYNERIPVAFGGLVFTEISGLHIAIPGYYLGNRIEQTTEQVEQIMAALRPQAAQRIVSYEYREALEHYRSRRSLIEAEVWQQMEEHLPRRHLAIANLNFGRNIIAALALGDIHYLQPDVDWIEGLLANHFELPPLVLDDFLESYHRALVHHLDARGDLIIAWMAQLLGKEESTHAP